MLKMKWWILLISRCVKLALAVPLAVAGIAALWSLFHDWRLWFLVILLPIYVAADFFLNIVGLLDYWDGKKKLASTHNPELH